MSAGGAEAQEDDDARQALTPVVDSDDGPDEPIDLFKRRQEASPLCRQPGSAMALL